MSVVSDVLIIQDRISSQMSNISRAMENSAASAELAKNEIDRLEKAQNEYKTTLTQIAQTQGMSSQTYQELSKAYDENSKELYKANAEYLKYQKQVMQAESKLSSLEKQQEATNKHVEAAQQATEKASGGFSKLQATIVTVSSAFQLIGQIKNFIMGAVNAMDKYIDAAQLQTQSENKLAIVTKQRMGLSDDEVRSLYELASAQQKVGVVGDEAAMAGMGLLARYTKQKESIEALTPALNNLAVSQYGYNVSAESMNSIGRMLGMAMQGQTMMLKRLGVNIDDNKKKWLMSLPEQQRAIELSKIITAVTGDMNEEFAKTPFGKITQSQNRLGDAMERIGYVLAPIKAAFLSTFTAIVESVVNNVGAITGAIALITAGLLIWQWQAIATGIANLAAFFPIIAIIGGVIAAIYIVSEVLKACGVDTNKLGGQILGVFTTVGAFIYNVFLGILDVALGIINQLINPFIIFGKFLVRVFQNPVEAIKQLFVDLGHNVLNALGTIASAIDKIFGSHLNDAVNNWKKQLPQASRMLNLSSEKLGMNRIEYNKAFKSGQNVNLTGLGKIMGKTGTGTGIDKYGEGGALKTKQQGSIELKEEDIKMLSELSTRDWSVRSQLLAPNVNFGNVTVNENADVSQFVQEFANGVSEVAERSLEVGIGK